MKIEEAISLLQKGLVGEIYDEKGYLTSIGYEALDAIDSGNCPTLVQKQYGEWIRHVDDLFPEESTEECSVCHEEQRITGNDDNFCPNCGADMRKESDGK